MHPGHEGASGAALAVAGAVAPPEAGAEVARSTQATTASSTPARDARRKRARSRGRRKERITIIVHDNHPAASIIRYMREPACPSRRRAQLEPRAASRLPLRVGVIQEALPLPPVASSRVPISEHRFEECRWSRQSRQCLRGSLSGQTASPIAAEKAAAKKTKTPEKKTKAPAKKQTANKKPRSAR